MQWPWTKTEVKPKLPSRILAIWTDAVHHPAGQKAQRGFGGRIVFYEDANGEPIQVDGQLTIYAFPDEDGKDGTAPERKFVFGAEELQRHYSKSSLGDSYSVWLPWDVVGGPSRHLTLIARFDSGLGGTVMSEPAKKMLPGVSKRTGESASGTKPDTGDASESGNEVSTPPVAVEPTIAGQLRPLPNAQEAEPLRTSTSASSPAALPTNTPAATRNSNRSIADFLQQELEAGRSGDSGRSPGDEEEATIRQVSYLDSGIVNDRVGQEATGSLSNRDSRVETIELSQLRSRHTGSIQVPQHWLRGDSEVQLAPNVKSEVNNSMVERSDNATIYYGRPGETLVPGNRVIETNEAAQESSERNSDMQWPRQTRTIGSNRRSIAEMRQQQILDRRPNLEQ